MDSVLRPIPFPQLVPTRGVHHFGPTPVETAGILLACLTADRRAWQGRICRFVMKPLGIVVRPSPGDGAFARLRRVVPVLHVVFLDQTRGSREGNLLCPPELANVIRDV